MVNTELEKITINFFLQNLEQINTHGHTVFLLLTPTKHSSVTTDKTRWSELLGLNDME